ncbi:hypothetical protein CC2G_002637 [Coprinopsis cinerea AmutBmut pab1-1]|nr:hypothetical protein CC2G_002637 [Coprinopsis cinerea AmutBmut pab1-1]
MTTHTHVSARRLDLGISLAVSTKPNLDVIAIEYNPVDAVKGLGCACKQWTRSGAEGQLPESATGMHLTRVVPRNSLGDTSATSPPNCQRPDPKA